ncbi:hypothetical protein KGM_211890 [Danaus plexippus plexippus]|uniref:Uncharacterized protein n=1 Tax=Danaus plexippus plexippus TaxID=278856 RepID=A0A212FKZ9_DANPL|nr:hypothetical protein KGM_211890 [Danaus plexippus plexippus]
MIFIVTVTSEAALNEGHFSDTSEICLVNTQEVRVREFYIAMQRCPYIHEMKERLLGAPADPERAPEQPDPQVGTIVKLNSDGYGSHTSPARAPLVADECDAPADETDALAPVEEMRCCQPDTKPKNAK